MFSLKDLNTVKMERLNADFPHSSDRINLKEYFKSTTSLVKTKMPWAFKGPEENTENCTSTILGQQIPQNEYMGLEESCSISKLEVLGEPQPIEDAFLNGKSFVDGFPCPSEHKLRTLSTIVEEGGECRKYGNRIWKKEPDAEQDLKINEDVIITLRVYDPFPSQVTSGLLRNTKDAVEILVLGSQTLTEFRDVIVCGTDFTVPGEMSDNPELAEGLQGKDLFKSGFIFIEDVFYNDFRHDTNIDYSDAIIKWADGKNIGPYTKEDMDKVHFIDLTVRFGYPYVYMHQGNCEHLIVFSYARFLHTGDTLQRSKYPICLPVYGKQAKYCMMCYQFLARWVVKESDRLPHDIFFFCKDCFFSFNYIDGKKIGKFQAYMYQEKLAFL